LDRVCYKYERDNKSVYNFRLEDSTWTGCVTCIRETVNAYIILDRKPERKIALRGQYTLATASRYYPLAFSFELGAASSDSIRESWNFLMS
jgi:hypothetical protein